MRRLHEKKIDDALFYAKAWPKEVASNPDGLFDTERMVALVRNVRPGDRVLDVGAGVFGAAQFIVQHRPDLKSCELNAFDQSYTARDIVTEIAPEIRWRLGEITDGLPFADKEFDVVISGETIEHMLSPESFASELMRVGKSVSVSTTNHECEQAKILDYPEHVWAIDENDLRRFFPGCEYELVGNIHIACWPASERSRGGFTTSRMLEIGGGDHLVEGYEQINEGWGFKPLPFEDETFDEVYSSHTIEHVPWWLTKDAISEAYRVLRRDGTLEIHTVDFEYLVRSYRRGLPGDKWQARGKNEGMHPMRWVASRIFSVADSPADPNWHRAIFDWDYLDELLTEAGFVNIEESKDVKGPMKHGPINIGIKGVK